VLRAADGTTLATSISFSSRAELENCLAYLRETVPFSVLAADGAAPRGSAHFCIGESLGGTWDFSLIGGDGYLILTSEKFTRARDCLAAINTLRAQTLDAGIVDTLV